MTDNTFNDTNCHSPPPAWETHDGGLTAASTAHASVGQSRSVMQTQLSTLTDKMNHIISSVQRQGEADRRRVAQLERKLENRFDERGREGDARERWAELQGSVNGLVEETQALSRRVDGLDQTVWARTSGTEIAKQRSRELEQKVQNLENLNRLASAMSEETQNAQKRQATKLRRLEQGVDDALRRLGKVEEDSRPGAAASREQAFEARLSALEQSRDRFDMDLQTMHLQLDDGLRSLSQELVVGSSHVDGPASVDEAIRLAQSKLSSINAKVSSQVDDLSSSVASLRVKVDGQLTRMSSQVERLQSAHEPAIEALRAELMQMRSQDRRDLDKEVAALTARLQQAESGIEETVADAKATLRQVSTPVQHGRGRYEESLPPAVAERLAALERCIANLQESPAAEAVDGFHPAAMNNVHLLELEELRRRLTSLEDRVHEVSEAGRIEPKQFFHAQGNICDLLQEVGRLREKDASGEVRANALQGQLQQLQTVLERRKEEETHPLRAVTELDARVSEISKRVTDFAARLLEVEASREIAHEGDTVQLADLSAVSSTAYGAGRALKAAGNSRAPTPDVPDGAELQDKLLAVARHLENLDDLPERVAQLEHLAKVQRGSGVEESVKEQQKEVSFADASMTLAQDVADLIQDIGDTRTNLKAVQDTAENDKSHLLSRVEEATTALRDELKSYMSDKLEEALSEMQQKLHVLKDELVSHQTSQEDVLERVEELENKGGELQKIADEVQKLRAQQNAVAALEAHQKEQAEEAESSAAAVATLKTQFIAIQKALQERDAFKGDSYPPSEAGGGGAQVEALMEDFQNFSAKVLDDLKSLKPMRQDLSEAEAGLEELKKHVKSLQQSVDEASPSAGPPVKQGLDEADINALQERFAAAPLVETLQKRLTAIETRPSEQSDIDELKDLPSRCDELAIKLEVLPMRCDKLEAKLADEIKTLASQLLECQALPTRCDDLEAKLEESSRAVKGNEAEASALLSKLQALEARHTKLDETLTDGLRDHSTRTADMTAMQERAMERIEKLEKDSPPAPPAAATASKGSDVEDQARAVAHARIADLTKEVAAEAERAKAQQEEFAKIGTSIGDLARRLKEVEESPAGEAEKGLSAALKASLDELRETIVELKQDLSKQAEQAQKAVELAKATDIAHSAVEKKLEAMQESRLDVTRLEGDANPTDAIVKQCMEELRREMHQLKSDTVSQAALRPATAVGFDAEEVDRGLVQAKAVELTKRATETLDGLAKHQDELLKSHLSLKDLSARVSGLGEGASADEVESLSRRMSTLEGGSSKDVDALKQKVEDLTAKLQRLEERGPPAEPSPSRKVGIAPGDLGSPSGATEVKALREKVESLGEKVEELAARQKGGKPPTGAHTPLDGSLNFSLTEQTNGGTLKDGSLNFSLTEATAKDSSLNYSLTEALSPKSSAQTASTASVPSSSEQAGAESRQDTKRRPAPVATEEDADKLATVAEEGEEEDEAEDTSLKSTSIKSSPQYGRRAGASSRSPNVAAESPSASADQLGVSQSCGAEMSIGVDVSVENSMELDENCDYFEDVVASTRRAAPAKRTGSVDALDQLMSRPASSSGPTSGLPEISRAAPKVAAKAPYKGLAGQADEAFEDDASSGDQSIEEELDNSQESESNKWGDEDESA